MTFCRRKKNNFDKITTFMTEIILMLGFNVGYQVCVILEFSSIQDETSHIYFKHIEDVHAKFCGQIRFFPKLRQLRHFRC